MNKEELENEAREKYHNHKIIDFQGFYNHHYYYLGYVESAEPREKRIEELEAQITDMKNYCCEVSKYLHDYSGVELNSPECRKRDILLIKELKLCEKWGDLR